MIVGGVAVGAAAAAIALVVAGHSAQSDFDAAKGSLNGSTVYNRSKPDMDALASRANTDYAISTACAATAVVTAGALHLAVRARQRAVAGFALAVRFPGAARCRPHQGMHVQLPESQAQVGTGS